MDKNNQPPLCTGTRESTPVSDVQFTARLAGWMLHIFNTMVDLPVTVQGWLFLANPFLLYI